MQIIGHRPKIQKHTNVIPYLSKWWKDLQRLSAIPSYQPLYQEIYLPFGTILLKMQVSLRDMIHLQLDLS